MPDYVMVVKAAISVRVTVSADSLGAAKMLATDIVKDSIESGFNVPDLSMAGSDGYVSGMELMAGDVTEVRHVKGE
jgi:hypothetical protein